MTGTEILEQFGQIIGREGNSPLDPTFAFQLMNTAKNSIEDITDFEYLKKKVTLSSSALPADFNRPLKIISYKTSIPLYPYEDYEIYSDGYYINYSDSTINLIGNTYSPTPVLTYIKTTDDIAAETSPLFPSRFHSLIAYEMAFIYQSGIDGDDLNFRMSSIHLQQRDRLTKLLVAWDSKLKLKNMGDITGYDPRYTDVGSSVLHLPSD